MTDINKEIKELKERIAVLESQLNDACPYPKPKGRYFLATYLYPNYTSFNVPLDDFDILKINQGIAYKSEEDCNKVKAANRTHCKIARIADRLNAGRKIDWSNYEQSKYYLIYDNKSKNHIRYSGSIWSFEAGVIYCLESDFFLKTVLKEIPKEELVNYFENFGKVQLWDYDYES